MLIVLRNDIYRKAIAAFTKASSASSRDGVASKKRNQRFPRAEIKEYGGREHSPRVGIVTHGVMPLEGFRQDVCIENAPVHQMASGWSLPGRRRSA